MYGLKIRDRSTFFTYFFVSECRLQDRKWRREQEFSDRVISVILAGLGATSRVLTSSVLHFG
jgi:hypothetical protein